MKTIFEHTQSRVLVIPQALYSMREIKLRWKHGNSMIFEKNLEQDLRNIEFYTNIPCLIYIESGTEVLTNSSHGIISLHTGDCIFLPQGHNLHSDFVRETKSLKATLVFFADTLVAGYIKNLKSIAKCRSVARGYCVIEKSCAIKTFFESIDYRIQEDAYLNTKLLELLHLIAHTDKSSTFHPLLSETKILPPKKNLLRLLETVDTINLSVSDLAHLSGRSLSTFNRDFKAIYHESAKPWLLRKRLSRARELLESDNYTVTDVAMMVGYSNVSHFIKAFKIRYGLTPKTVKYNEMTEKR
jgi:AraC family transcriptional regulator, exoenzyme S synthesis regulatory protein ExsA